MENLNFNSANEEISEIGKDKLNSLKDSIKEIELMISERKKLSKQINDEAEKVKIGITNFLLETSAVDAEDAKERTGLRQKQVEVSELQLKEKISCWQDIAKLKQELRDKQKELSDKESRFNMLNNILEE